MVFKQLHLCHRFGNIFYSPRCSTQGFFSPGTACILLQWKGTFLLSQHANRGSGILHLWNKNHQLPQHFSCVSLAQRDTNHKCPSALVSLGHFRLLVEGRLLLDFLESSRSSPSRSYQQVWSACLREWEHSQFRRRRVSAGGQKQRCIRTRLILAEAIRKNSRRFPPE